MQIVGIVAIVAVSAGVGCSQRHEAEGAIRNVEFGIWHALITTVA
jgi:hypothetical protein